jgi:hypothetical protein
MKPIFPFYPLELYFVDCWPENKRGRRKGKEEEIRRIAKLIFLRLLHDYICLFILLSAHISSLSGAKLYFPVSLCALNFSLFECGMFDGNFYFELWFNFIDVSTESFLSDFVVVYLRYKRLKVMTLCYFVKEKSLR